MQLKLHTFYDSNLNGYATMGELLIGLTKYFAFCSNERPYQAMGEQTPNAVFVSGIGGGAVIVYKYYRRDNG